MKKIFLLTALSLLLYTIVFSQITQIELDGQYDDWQNATSNYTDPQGDGANIDMLSFSVSNDSNFLYIKLEFADEMQLNSGNSLFLEIDTDNDAGTGYSINGIGGELGWKFGSKFGYFNVSTPGIQVNQADIKFRALPTVTSNMFEIAINRHVFPDNINPLFTNDTIKICFFDQVTNGDYMPNNGTQFSYIFDNSSFPAFDVIDINKSDTSFVRLMTYNTLFNGLIDSQREDAFGRIISAANPDIITFNECWSTQWYEARNFLDNYLPLTSGDSWQCWKVDGANITCSRYPITQNWQILSDRRLTASLIDLPAYYSKDILIVNAHLKCCDGDTIRQREADAFAAFIKDAKTAGGVIDLPQETPFLLSGDLNLVGFSQQLTTLITGDIQDTITFGSPSPLDWDNTNLNDVISLQSDHNMAFTWIDEGSDYWPGRLDFCIASDVNLTVEKAFTMRTEIMSTARLTQYGLQQFDTQTASDHLPKVTDFSIPLILGNQSSINKIEIKVSPNPAKNKILISTNISNKENRIKLLDANGDVVYSETFSGNSHIIDTSNLIPAIYIVKLWNSDYNIAEKVVIVK